MAHFNNELINQKITHNTNIYCELNYGQQVILQWSVKVPCVCDKYEQTHIHICFYFITNINKL